MQRTLSLTANLLLVLLTASFFSPELFATDAADKTVIAVRTGNPPVIDGVLNDPAWSGGVAMSRFTQKDPVEYGEPSARTDVIILYDDNALYVGARMYDAAPDSIIARLVRRDVDTESDLFGVYLDPFFDRRSGYHFGVNAAGVRYDGVRYNDSWSDDSWDGVWEGEVSRDDSGWCAELRIPFSQVRFARKDRYVWGINYTRRIGRHNEENLLAITPNNESGFVSRFWTLTGIEGISPPRYFELLPYVRGSARYEMHTAGDPFYDGSEYNPNAGADFKMGIGSNLALNATVNPDFGQVEVDPAVLNLSDVETYFSEKRPFFVEGSRNFDFGYGGASDYWGFNWSNPSFFYSRRIGRTPQGTLSDFNYARVPDGTHILGAGKLSGKLGGNWNVGSLHAVTMREHADIEYNGRRSRLEVEPAAYYQVSRAQKELNDGAQGIGVIGTGTTRLFDDPRLEADVNGTAYSGGVDGWTFFGHDRAYCLTGWMGLSHIAGTPERITSVQRSSRHYFQRPDARSFDVDSAATSMTGYAGRLLLNKERGNILLNSAVGVISPEFDVNDVGFMYRADVINAHVGSGYQWPQPTAWTRYANVLGAAYSNFNFDGDHTWGGVWLQTRATFLNYWSGRISAAVNPDIVNVYRTRGGPKSLFPAGWEFSASGATDSRKPWEFDGGTWGHTISPRNWNRGVWLGTTWKPASNVSLSFAPELFWNQDWLRWVDAFDDPAAMETYGVRYVFAEMYQTELSASLRLNWTFTPKLSLQMYAQPLISSGEYRKFKELSRPNSYDFYTYPAADVEFDGQTYTIDPDGDGPAEALDFANPDFDYRSLRGNMILRWEYRPGSTLYLVWTHGRSDWETAGRFNLDRSADRLFSADSNNILLLKISYWLSR